MMTLQVKAVRRFGGLGANHSAGPDLDSAVIPPAAQAGGLNFLRLV